MKQVLIGLLLADIIVLAAAAVLGWTCTGERGFALHFALGLFAAIYTALMHSIIYIFFIVSGKVVIEAADRAGLEPHWVADAKRLKMRTFRVLLLGILAAIVTALLGGNVFMAGSARGVAFDASKAAGALTAHMISAILTIVVQPLVGYVEFRSIGRQHEIMSGALARLEAWKRSQRDAAGAAAHPSTSPA